MTDINYRARKMLEDLLGNKPQNDPPKIAAEYETLTAYITEHLRQVAAEAREAALRDVNDMLKPKEARPCNCARCTCGNVGDAESVARYDQASEDAAAVTAILALEPPK